MTSPAPDARVSAWLFAWNTLQTVQDWKKPPKGVRVAPEPLPEHYWAAIAEAAIYADLARADITTGLTAGAVLVATETAKQAAMDTLADVLGVKLNNNEASE